MRLSFLPVLLALPVLAGCAANRYLLAPYDDLTLRASDRVNPDVSGQASPVGVKIYELTARSTFDNLDFEGVYSNARTLLSDQLLSSSKYLLQPGEAQSYRIDLHESAEYVAVVAAYRDIDRVRWKLVYPVNANWYQEHTVRLGSEGLEATR